MMKKSVGVIGNTGRMGSSITEALKHSQTFQFGTGFNNSCTESYAIIDVFNDNDYVVDFSNAKLIAEILKAAILRPKPLVLCTTGWNYQEHSMALQEAARTTPIVIAPNTSMGAFLQRHLAKQLAQFLDDYYDIDIFEKHHRNKIDIPSGSALNILHDIEEIKEKYHQKQYKNYHMTEGPRPKDYIGLNFERSGSTIGEHQVTFASEDEEITIKHVALNRSLFAHGALRILQWLENTQTRPGIYSMQDVLGLD